VQVPALVLHGVNDPFIPASSLPTREQVSASVTLWQPGQGGHVGFPVAQPRRPATHVLAMPQAVLAFLAQAL
jgi:predicted alpha/beta-fold hydrolase